MKIEFSHFQQAAAWRGRQRHSNSTHAWLHRAKEQTTQWPKNGLSDNAIVKLVNALPTLARDNPDLFEASTRLLLAQSQDPAWQGILKRRLAVIRRAVEGPRPNLRGEALAFFVRNDAWIGKKDLVSGQWMIHDGRHLEKFIQHGNWGRKLLWSSLIKMPCLTRTELPTKHLGHESWATAVAQAGQFLNSNQREVRQALCSGRTWGLAIRRIKRLGLRGLFDPDTQTVIVDPRHPDTLLHELAHWVLNHNHRFEPIQAERQVHALLEKFKDGEHSTESRP